jgi:hypothetical protein
MKNMLQVALVLLPFLLPFLLSVSASHSAVRGPRGHYVENDNDAVKDGGRRTRSKSGFKISSDEDFAPPGDGRCVICSSGFKGNKPAALTLEYKPEGKNSQFQPSDKATCRAGTYPPTATLHVENKGGTTQKFEVEKGTAFTSQGPFDENTYFSFFSTTYEDQFGNPDHLGDCTIHTSCSAPLVQGDQIGPFFILGGGVCSPDGPPESGLESCNGTLDVICRENSTGLPCDEFSLVMDECLELPSYMSFRYNGGDCNQSSNIQPPEAFVCEDFHGGGPPTDEEESSFIVATNVNNGDIHHAEFVRVGELFTVKEIDGAFPSAMNITVYSSADTSPQSILQTVVMDTSCSQNMFLTDRYGSFHLVGFINEPQGNVTSFVGATYSYFVSNAATESGSEALILSTLTSITNEFVNLTEQVNGVVLPTTDSLVVKTAFIVDLSARLLYTIFSTVQGVAPGGFVCRATHFDSFTAGRI